MNEYPRLKDVGRWLSGGTPPSDDEALWDGDVPWISAKDIDSTRLREATAFISAEAAQRHSRVVGAGAILIIVRGMALAHGLPVVLTEREVAFNQDLRALVPGPSIHPPFLHYSFIGHRHRLGAHIDRAAHGTARVIDSIYGERIWLPACEHQEAVAGFLDGECARIAALLSSAASFAERTLWTHWEGAAYQILGSPEPTVRLKYLVEGPVGGAWGDEPHADSNTAACARVADFDRARMAVAGVPTVRAYDDATVGRLELKADDLLLEKSGGGASSPVGFVVRAGCEAAGGVFSNFVARLRPRGSDSLYLVHLFGALYFTGHNIPFIRQVTGIQNLDVAAYLTTHVPSRALDVQRSLGARLATGLSRALTARTKGEELADRLAEYRDALITEAVTGQLDVTRVSDLQMEERAHAAMEGEPLEAVR